MSDAKVTAAMLAAAIDEFRDQAARAGSPGRCGCGFGLPHIHRDGATFATLPPIRSLDNDSSD